MYIRKQYAQILCVLIASLAINGRVICAQRVDSEAVAGEPFGVARVTLPLQANDAAIVASHGYTLSETDGRVFYPVFIAGRPAEAAKGEQQKLPRSFSVMFLFKGDGPLTIRLGAASQHTLTIAVRKQPRVHTRLLRRWWRRYHAQWRVADQQADSQPILANYLTTMLSQRLGLPTPLLSRKSRQPLEPPAESLELLLGTERMRMQVMRETLQGRTAAEGVANLPLPEPIAWTPPTLPEANADVTIEKIAMRVPEECFYVRFGHFSNYLWLSRLLEENGGDLARLIMLRGHQASVSERFRHQLALKETALSELFGSQVISDVALIGRDLFFREGAAAGILFQAKSNVLLANQINSQRSSALTASKDSGATMQTVRVAGQDVSLLSTPDNRLRSFYVAVDNFHLVTTSREVARRFIEASQGKRSLGASTEFRQARSQMSVARDDTVFVYLSAAFFEGLLSPRYRIELRRRLQAATDLELVQLGSLAAAHEQGSSQKGNIAQTFDIRVPLRAGVLPRDFGRRADGSHPVNTASGQADSLRGGRGTFIPVADVDVDRITQFEQADFAEVASFHRTAWPSMDPVMIGIRRFSLKQKGRERITIDAQMPSFGKSKYGKLVSRLGPPTRTYVKPDKQDVLNIQAIVQGESDELDIPLHHFFFAIQDIDYSGPLPSGGLVPTLRFMSQMPAYLGAWPKSGFLDRMTLGLVPPADENGYSPLLFGLSRRIWNDYSLVSGNAQILAAVPPRLHTGKAESAAQVRLTVADLSTTKITSLINRLTYGRARQTTLGNLRLLHALSQQLGVSPAEAKSLADNLLDARLVCSLGGEYQLVDEHGVDKRLPYWTSTKLASISGSAANSPAAAEHQAALLQWFRGLKAELTMPPGRLELHAQFDMQRKPNGVNLHLPNWNLFGVEKKAEPKAKSTVEF